MAVKMAEQCLNTDEGECSSAKRIKLDTEKTSEDNDSVHEAEVNLSSFKVTNVLQNNCKRKQICIQGTFKGRESPAIILLEKKNFPLETPVLEKELFNEDTILRKLYTNDVYGNYECFPTKEYNSLNATVIHPATPKHIAKFKKKNVYVVEETYELYQKITLPYIESHSFSSQWIYNILEHKAEEDKIIYEDKDEKIGFIIVQDFRWDGHINTLKLLAIPFQKIRSIRELNESHLPLLKNIRDAGIASITKKYDIPASQLRVYFHYQPTYYYLHVHFAYLMFEPPGISVEKAHLLSTVISNIELMPDYYTKAVLSYIVAEGETLCTKYQEHGILSDTKTKSEDV